MEDLLAPPGFRFYPTEEELVSFYLHNKLEAKRDDLNRVMDRVIPVLYIYEHSPWELPAFSGEFCHGDPEQWFFFVPRQESEVRGGRPSRLTNSGYWKATGSPGYVYASNNRIIGVKRTMVYYEGRAPDGTKTDWKMNEYKAIVGEASTSNAAMHPNLREEFSICRVYKRSKCLRAFDRRPSAGVMTGPQTMPLQISTDEATTSQHNAARNVTGSPDDSPSSGDLSHRFFAGESSSTGMNVAIDHNEIPAWDWDQLDLLDDMQ